MNFAKALTVLLVLAVAGSTSAAKVSKKCRKYNLFCERWMCQQNANAGSTIYPLSECQLEKPPSLVATGKLASIIGLWAVQSYSLAITATGLEKSAKAAQLYDQGKASCAANPSAAVHPCVCDASVTRAKCQKLIKFDVFSNKKSPYFQQSYYDLYAGRFIQNNKITNEALGVDTGDAAGSAFTNCVERYGAAACGAVSPAAKRRRQLRSHLPHES